MRAERQSATQNEKGVSDDRRTFCFFSRLYQERLFCVKVAARDRPRPARVVGFITPSSSPPPPLRFCCVRILRLPPPASPHPPPSPLLSLPLASSPISSSDCPLRWRSFLENVNRVTLLLPCALSLAFDLAISRRLAAPLERAYETSPVPPCVCVFVWVCLSVCLCLCAALVLLSSFGLLRDALSLHFDSPPSAPFSPLFFQLLVDPFLFVSASERVLFCLLPHPSYCGRPLRARGA